MGEGAGGVKWGDWPTRGVRFVSSANDPVADISNLGRLNTLAYTTSRSSRWGCLIAGVGVILLVLATYAFMTGYLPFKLFNSQQWKQAERSGDDARLRMIEPLMNSGRLDGLTRSEVVSLLGPPDDTNYFRDYDFVYWLGPERGLLSLDSEWLVIRFGASSVVSEYRVVSD